MHIFIFVLFFIFVDGRVLDKNFQGNIPNKVFDYYDVAKGNIYLTESDKLLEPYIEDGGFVKIKHSESDGIQAEVAPAETQSRDSESYDEYAEDSLNKPLETPTLVDSDIGPVLHVKDSNSTLSTVSDEMILVTIKPLCDN